MLHQSGQASGSGYGGDALPDRLAFIFLTSCRFTVHDVLTSSQKLTDQSWLDTTVRLQVLNRQMLTQGSLKDGAGQRRHARAARDWPENPAEDAVDDEDPMLPEAADDSDADPVSR